MDIKLRIFRKKGPQAHFKDFAKIILVDEHFYTYKHNYIFFFLNSFLLRYLSHCGLLMYWMIKMNMRPKVSSL